MHQDRGKDGGRAAGGEVDSVGRRGAPLVSANSPGRGSRLTGVKGASKDPRALRQTDMTVDCQKVQDRILVIWGILVLSSSAWSQHLF